MACAIGGVEGCWQMFARPRLRLALNTLLRLLGNLMTTPDAAPDSHAGQAIYSPLTLALYDVAVLGISNSLIWRCPTRRILALYDQNVTDEHLDVGVGTGWYLDHCKFPPGRPRLGLMDLNPHSLVTTARRITRYQPLQYQADVLRSIEVDTLPFRSISLTYLLHCLPGSIEEKAVAFDNLAPLLRPDGVMFGATLLSIGVKRSGAARALMRTYNRKGVFSNEVDSLDGLRAALDKRFTDVTLEVAGCSALFLARGLKVR
jgi:hypothetical protein